MEQKSPVAPARQLARHFLYSKIMRAAIGSSRNVAYDSCVVVNIGDVVTCCPKDQCALPPGLPKDTPVKVMAAYVGTTYVVFNDRTFVVPNACIHPAGVSTFAPPIIPIVA